MSITKTFRLSDLKYLMAYSGPLIAFFGIYIGGYWIYSNPFYVFVILPLLESLLTRLGYDITEEEEEEEEDLVHWIFDIMLYLNFPITLLILYLSINTIIYTDFSTIEFVGLIITTGIVLSSHGINVAHELCHRENSFEKSLGKLMLLPSSVTISPSLTKVSVSLLSKSCCFLTVMSVVLAVPFDEKLSA